jgi:uncharacterized membrane protein
MAIFATIFQAAHQSLNLRKTVLRRTKPTLLPTRVTSLCSVQCVVKVKSAKDFQLFNIETKK